MKIKFLFITLLIYTISFSQTKGTISGVLTDKDSNNASLPFANATIKGTTTAVTSDEKGNYSLSVLPGTYIIVFSFLGYENIEVPLSIKAGEKITINRALGSGSYKLEDVVVKSKSASSREKESALLLEQKNAVVMQQAIGAQEMSRKGISDVEAGLTKITGITKVGSRGIFVRGLEDRYNTLLINGLQTPSNNPFKKIIPLDLFPTDLVSVLKVYKTFNPDIPGDFGGGTFDIITQKGRTSSTKISFGSGYTTNNNLRKFTISKDADGSKGFFGLTSIDRQLNTSIFGTIPSNKTLTAGESQQAFNSGWDATETKSPLNTSIGFSHSEKFDLANDKKISYLLGLNWDNTYLFREGQDNTFNQNGAFDNKLNATNNIYKTSFSSIIGLNYDTNRTKLSFSTLYLRSTENQLLDQLGYTDQLSNNPNKNIRTNQLDQSDYLNAQLSGAFDLTENKNQTLLVGGSLVKTAFQQPDRKFTTGTLTSDNQLITNYGGNNFLRQYLDISGNYYGSGMAEYNLKFGHKEDKEFKLSLGYNGSINSTKSSYRFVSTVNNSSLGFTQPINSLDNQINTDLSGDTFNYRESSNASYKVLLDESANAGYANLLYTFLDKWEINGGLRFESTDRQLKYRGPGSFTDAYEVLNYTKNYVLPSLNLKYAVTEKANLRLASSKTYTRPVIMEAYPLEYINADGTSIVGNKDLVNSDNYNVDLKYELFPTTKETFSIGVFGKQIINPIERQFIATASGSGNVTSYLNSDKATIYGAEIEGILDFGRFSNHLKDFSLGFNTSLMSTNVKSTNPIETHRNRELQGASNWIVNSDIKYQFNLNSDWKNTMTLVYSVFGKRIYSVGTGGMDHIYELPINQLDFIWGSKIGKHWETKFSADNILNPLIVKELGNNSTLAFYETNRTTQDYKKGVGFSLSLGYTF